MVYNCEWFKVYDFLESIHSALGVKRRRQHDYEGKTQAFQDALNEFFVDEGIGWQMIEDEIVTRGTEVFESNVHGAIEALEAAGRMTSSQMVISFGLVNPCRFENDFFGLSRAIANTPSLAIPLSPL